MDDRLWSAKPDRPEPPATAESAQSETAAAPADGLVQPPQLGETNFRIEPSTAAATSGTFVGSKVSELRSDLSQLQESINAANSEFQTVRQKTVANAMQYHERVAGMRSRLQIGTTPGNPGLVQAWDEAQAGLEAINVDIGQMNALSNRIAGHAAMSVFLLESTRASFDISGAVDEDHRQLAVLEDDISRTMVIVERLLTELSDDIRRQSNYVTNERGTLNLLALAIKNGEYFGSSLVTAGTAAVQPVATPPSPLAEATGSRRPLITIRFDRPDVDYQQALYTAVNSVLQRQPDATFDLVAVSATEGGTARSALNANVTRRNAQAVLRSLTEMGLPPERVALSAVTSPDNTNEVRLYLR